MRDLRLHNWLLYYCDSTGWENFAKVLLRAEFPGVDGFDVADGSSGDGGVDGWIPGLARVFSIWCPSKPEDYLEKALAKAQRDTRRIKNKGRELYDVEFNHWTFVTTRDLTPDYLNKIEESAKKHGFKFEHFGMTKVIEMMLRHPQVIQLFVPFDFGGPGRELLEDLLSDFAEHAQSLGIAELGLLTAVRPSQIRMFRRQELKQMLPNLRHPGLRLGWSFLPEQYASSVYSVVSGVECQVPKTLWRIQTDLTALRSRPIFHKDRLSLEGLIKDLAYLWGYLAKLKEVCDCGDAFEILLRLPDAMSKAMVWRGDEWNADDWVEAFRCRAASIEVKRNGFRLKDLPDFIQDLAEEVTDFFGFEGSLPEYISTVLEPLGDR